MQIIKSFLRTSVYSLAFVLAIAVTAVGQGIQRETATDAMVGRPTVSPYLNLAIRNQYGLSNYQTHVRPMLEQQAMEQRSAVGSAKLRNRTSAISSSGSRHSSQMRAVPQTARYMNYSHFYGGTKTR